MTTRPMRKSKTTGMINNEVEELIRMVDHLLLRHMVEDQRIVMMIMIVIIGEEGEVEDTLMMILSRRSL